MEYLSGGELYNVVRKELKCELKKVMYYMVEVAIGISFMHENNVVHRDIKPENILIDSFGHAMIIDLGLSKRLEANYTATICGTPEYLAPEQLLKKSK
jgi:serine/threonine protein kinase